MLRKEIKLNRRAVLLGCLVLVLAACMNQNGNPLVTTSAPLSDGDDGPFLVNDPFDVVTGLSWLDLNSEQREEPIEYGGPVAALMHDSTPATLHITVNGGGCVPRVRISILQPPPALELGIEVGEGIAAPGYQCNDNMTTHAFEMRLAEPVNLDEVTFIRVLFEEPSLDR